MVMCGGVLHQCICVGNSGPSCLRPVLSLEPLLFLMYINDLPQAIKHSIMFLFVDDAKCLKQVSQQSTVQSDLYNLGNWSSEWKLNFKAAKCVHLSFCKKAPLIESSYIRLAMPL